jgi:hypothetical protein
MTISVEQTGTPFFWPWKEWRNFGRAGSRTGWPETKNIQIKFATICNKNGQQQQQQQQQQDAKNNAEL